MNKSLDLIGTVLGSVGVLGCLAAAIARLNGVLTFGGSEILTWFVIGIALVAVGCFAKLQAMSMRPR